jgi:outer membrane lipoprotein-sorting protein
MRNSIIFVLLTVCFLLGAQQPTGQEVLQNIDANMFANEVISVMSMTIHAPRTSKTMRLKSYTQGDERSFSEYLSPPRDAGTKMLKLQDNLWIYEPDADRTIQISGHMLRQSMMGSDLSYEDMMEENRLELLYDAEITGREQILDRDCWIVRLTAKVPDAAYQSRTLWVDAERWLALKEERFGKSGTLLKTTEIKEVFMADGRWYPRRMIIKDALKAGKGTEIVFEEMQFNATIPPHYFSKAALRK